MPNQTAKLTILGSGTMMPTKERNPAGFLLELDNKRILLDCGFGTIRRLVDYGIDPQTINAVFISHFHPDHFGDAFNLVIARAVEDTFENKKSQKLLFIGPKELEKRYKMWRQIYWLEAEDYPLEFKEGIISRKIGSARIETFEIKHVTFFQSVAIRIRYDGKKIVYTGDLGSRQNINDLARETQNADLLIIEANFEKPTPNHFTLKQVEGLTKKANIKKVLVVHVPPHRISETKQLISQNPKFELGKDGKVVEI